MKTKLLLMSGAIVLLLASCVDELFIRGNGIPVREDRLVPAFSSLSSEGPFDVQVISGDQHKVLVHAESNLLPYIDTEVKGNNLKIKIQGMHGLKNQLPLKVFVTAPHIEKVVQSGSGNIVTDLFEGESVRYVISGSGTIEALIEVGELEAVVSGSGNLLLSGKAENAHLAVSGSGKIDGWNLLVRNCDVTISGSGDVWVDVDQYLKAIISGSGHVFYSGAPNIEMVVSGSGSVIHKN